MNQRRNHRPSLSSQKESSTVPSWQGWAEIIFRVGWEQGRSPKDVLQLMPAGLLRNPRAALGLIEGSRYNELWSG